MHQDNKNTLQTSLGNKVTETQDQHQGKLDFLKRKKQESQSLKTILYYTTLPFEQFDSFMTAPKHKATQLRWLPFPSSPAEAVLCSANTNTEHH